MVLGLYHTVLPGTSSLRQQALRFPQRLQLTAADVAEVMRKQATGSNIHCGTSSKRAVSNGSSAQRKTVSAFFLSTVHTPCARTTGASGRELPLIR